MEPIQIDAVVVYFGKNKLWQACFSLNCSANGKSVVKHLMDAELLQQKGCKYGELEIAGETLRYILSTVENLDDCKDRCDNHSDNCTCGHSLDDIFLLNPRSELFGHLTPKSPLSNESLYVIFMTLREVFLHRNRAYQHFPLAISRRYWENVSFPPESLQESFIPPWIVETTKPEAEKTRQPWIVETTKPEAEKARHRVSTITLSLDLRKSTISMEQAIDLGKFADWMRDLIEKLTEIALEHLAVFDKFTGDGIIVHFLEHDVNRLIPLVLPTSPLKTPMELAVVCAARMVMEVDQRLVALRKFLQSDFSNLGAAVGLAVGWAKWSSDHTGNPIVVGRGVVGACRACGAPHGVIRLANSAYQGYRDTALFMRAPPTLKPLKSKDFPEDIDLKMWELQASDILEVIPCGAPLKQA